jgi:hypothetical protein
LRAAWFIKTVRVALTNTGSDIDQMMAEEWFSLREDLQEQERFVENIRRCHENESDVPLYLF